MKSNLIRTLTLGAAALTLSLAAYGQSTATAKIPFSFRVNGTQLPAGKYSIKRVSDTANVLMLSDGNHRSMLKGINATAYEPGAPRLIFRCRETTGCALAEVWEAGGRGVAFPNQKLTPAEKERLAVVPMKRSEAE
jgi:hypothetical protein